MHGTIDAAQIVERIIRTERGQFRRGLNGNGQRQMISFAYANAIGRVELNGRKQVFAVTQVFAVQPVVSAAVHRIESNKNSPATP